MGEFLDEGMGIGVEKKAGWLHKKIKKLGKTVLTDFQGINDDVESAMNFGSPVINAKRNVAAENGSAANGKIVNVYQTNHYSQAHSRYEIYKSEQNTAAAVRLAIGGAT